ncbi:MAG: ribosome recycling factor [Planifilum sp.]|jgi:ribosome recycling factor|uniref:Ribosome-recycling factor n=1 Tax=Novibacillus thermophilus TaxID=1471761 RepID=A0A1U9KA17_9BACL|nr:ribosome recycling factor [Novibacillus thermophilus]AQS56861.1 ribosome recycling factor [Novibacillus thermophilus]
MPESVKSDAKSRMEKTLQALRRELASLRAGRAAPSLLDKIEVEYYGTMTPLNQLSNISAPEPRLLVIQPWDKSAISAIEKALQKSELGITPTNDGDVIRISIPPLTEERRAELVRVVKKAGEEAKVSIRNIRRDANDEYKKMEKLGDLSEDEARRYQEEIQKLTDDFVKQIDEAVTSKEKDIMTV